VGEQQSLSAMAAAGEPVTARRDQDWAGWLRHACRAPLPATPPPSVGREEAAWTALTHLARREGFSVERANCADGEGFTTWRNRRIRIKPSASPAQAVTALAHQLGHVLLHSQIAKLESSGTVPCTGLRKVEADSVAYLTATHLGIDPTTITFPHASSWAGADPRAHPATTIKTVTTRILTATGTVKAILDTAGLTHRVATASARATDRAPARRAASPVPADEIARAHASAAEFFRSQLPGSWVPGYLASRGFSPAVQDHWQAGYAPAAWDALISHLRAAGYTDTVIEAAGLARRSRRGTLIDTFRDRAMLPIRSTEGVIIAFIGRAPEHAEPGIPRYLNSPATSMYDKSQVLFGLWEARDPLTRGARPVIVEGPLDAIAVTTAGHGRYAGVAPCGVALTGHHVALLSRAADLRATGVSVAFDPDEAGRRAAVRACHLLAPVTEKMAAVIFPAGQDPAKILASAGPSTLARILETQRRPLPDLVIDDVIHHWGNRLRHPEGQLGALRTAAPLIASLPPAHIARQVDRLAVLLRLDHATVTEAVTDAVTRPALGQPDSSRHHVRPDQSGRPSRHQRAALPGGKDFGHDARQAVEHADPAATSPPARGRPPSVDQPRLPARRRAG